MDGGEGWRLVLYEWKKTLGHFWGGGFFFIAFGFNRTGALHGFQAKGFSKQALHLLA